MFCWCEWGIRCKLGKLKLVFVDEISMVGSCMSNLQLNRRLKDIKGSEEDFGGVGIIASLQPVMDGYIFKDVDNSEYGVPATNLKMYELHEILRQRESILFAGILNRLREGNHTQDDILKMKETHSTKYPYLSIRCTSLVYTEC